jgi:Putative Actinobacterial Holin-X, holin superfamily III
VPAAVVARRRSVNAYGRTLAGRSGAMSVPGVDQLGEVPLEALVENASQQAVALAREQVNVARRELAARAREAGPGVAMLSGGALLAVLASGTGTAALILALARRPGASAAALGVTGAYAGGGAFLVRMGVDRLREVGPPVPETPVEDEPVENTEQDRGSAKRRAKSAADSPGRVKSAARASRPVRSAAKSAGKATDRAKPGSQASRRRASGTQTQRARRRAS